MQPIGNLRWLRPFAQAGHEVAGHGLRHVLWPDYPSSYDDLSSARRTLEDLVDQPVVGHAFPGGLWNPVAARAAWDAGFRYTSEAALAWAGHPFSPRTGSDPLPLQVPCSPVYPAFRQLGENGEDAFLAAFQAMARDAAREREPLSWMGHPFDLEDASPRLWEGVEQTKAAFGFHARCMGELCALAAARQSVGLQLFRREGEWWASTSRPWELLLRDGGVVVDQEAKPLSACPYSRTAAARSGSAPSAADWSARRARPLRSSPGPMACEAIPSGRSSRTTRDNSG